MATTPAGWAASTSSTPSCTRKPERRPAMAAIKIYGVPPSTFTRTVRLACHEKGIDYELVPMFPGQIGALNPFYKIPAITHGDLTLYESTAILRYLDRTFPGPGLWPEESRQ